MAKEKIQKNKQRSTKHIYKTKDRVTLTPLKTGGELRCSGRVELVNLFILPPYFFNKYILKLLLRNYTMTFYYNIHVCKSCKISLRSVQRQKLIK